MNLSRLKSEMETGLTFVRRTKTKVAIHGMCHDGADERVEFLRKGPGITIKWSGNVSVESEETEKCDLGHEHKISKDTHWVWNYATLTRADVAALVDFLREESA